MYAAKLLIDTIVFTSLYFGLHVCKSAYTESKSEYAKLGIVIQAAVILACVWTYTYISIGMDLAEIIAN